MEEKQIIKKSSDNKTHIKRQDNTQYYYLPEEQYEEYKKKTQSAESKEEINQLSFNRKQNSEWQNKDKEDFIQYADQTLSFMTKKQPNRKDIIEEMNDWPSKEKTESQAQSQPSFLTIKKPVTLQSDKQYKSKKGCLGKALLAVLLISAGVGIGVHVTRGLVKDYMEYKKVAESVSDLSNAEIHQSIEDILKQEISEGTGKNVEDIQISHEQVDKIHDVVTIKAGDEQYEMVHETDSLFPEKGNLKSGRVRSLIADAQTALTNNDRKGLIRALKETKEFSKTKDLQSIDQDGDGKGDILQEIDER